METRYPTTFSKSPLGWEILLRRENRQSDVMVRMSDDEAKEVMLDVLAFLQIDPSHVIEADELAWLNERSGS